MGTPNQRTLLEPTTSSGYSEVITATDTHPVTLIVYSAGGLVAGEDHTIQISHDGGNTWQDLYMDGALIQLTSTNVAKTIYGPGTFRVSKSATTNAAGIYATY